MTCASLSPGAPVAPLLTADGLSFSHPGRPLFAGFCRSFGPGLTWVRGDMGSGKSTLLRLLAGELTPQAGRLSARGIDLQTDPRGYRQQVVLCGPEPLGHEALTPPQVANAVGQHWPGLDRTALPALWQALDLQPHLHKRLDMLSTGTGRKLAVSLALVAGAPVTLIDEPLSGVDRASTVVLQQALAALAGQPGRAVIVASHDDLGQAAHGATVLDLDDLQGGAA